MSIDTINKNPDLLRKWIDDEKLINEEYYRKNPDSLVLLFEEELRELGFEFEVTSQTIGFMPKHR